MNEYQQLKHLKSQNIIVEHTNESVVDIDKILEKEKNDNKNSSWNKLNKVDKVRKLNEFAVSYGEEHNLLPKEVKEGAMQVEEIDDVDLQLVWDPPWNKDMMSDAAKLELNL